MQTYLKWLCSSLEVCGAAATEASFCRLAKANRIGLSELSPCQGWGREFESLRPLQFSKENQRIMSLRAYLSLETKLLSRAIVSVLSPEYRQESPTLARNGVGFPAIA
jgi:hypothetical protein